MATRFIFLTVVLGCTAFTGACSVLIDVDAKQCQVDADCTQRGAAFEGSVCRQSLCVLDETNAGGTGGAPGEENPLVCKIEPNEQEKVKFTFAPVFAVPPAEPQPFKIKACLSLDPDCKSPIVGPIDVNAGQPYDFEVPKLFDGFFQFENPGSRTGLYHMGRPLTEDTIGWNVTIPDDNTISALGLAAGETVDLNLGVMIAVARDCNRVPIEGAKFENSQDDKLRFYFYQTTPDPDATETGPQGAVGYANLEPGGSVKINAVAADGTRLTPVGVRIKAGAYVSFAEVFP